MKTLIAVSLATLYGLLLRLMYGILDNIMGIMSVSFLIIAPVVIGFLTIILIPKEKTKGFPGAFFKPWLTSLAILIITMLFNIEGSICWIMIYPLFSILAGIGGVIAFNYRENKSQKSKNNDWENPSKLNISFILFIPAFLGLIEGDKALIPKEIIIQKSIQIDASSSEVWKQLTNTKGVEIQPSAFSLSSMIGFPKHLRTTLDTLQIGGKRKAIYEKGLYFDETISSFENEKKLVLDIKTDPTKIPPTVMDEHIVIGGKHIDLIQDIYSLKELPNNACELTLSSRFKINTPFNWYAGIWAHYLMSDILKEELTLIKNETSNNIK